MVEPMFPKGALVVICHVFAFAVDAFEVMRAWFTLGSFQSWRVQFEIGFAVPC